MPLYIHDESQRILYEIRDEPTVTERRDKSGKRIDWVAHMELHIIRPDNLIVGGRWKYPITTNLQEHYDPRDSREQVASFFKTNNIPHGSTITDEEFIKLKAQYQGRA